MNEALNKRLQKSYMKITKGVVLMAIMLNNPIYQLFCILTAVGITFDLTKGHYISTNTYIPSLKHLPSYYRHADMNIGRRIPDFWQNILVTWYIRQAHLAIHFKVS